MTPTLKSQLKRHWKRRKYYAKLEWIHPFWLRAVVSLLIAIPAFVLFVICTTAIVLLGPLVIFVKFVGFSLGVILWLALYMFLFWRFSKWLKRHNQVRPRRPIRRG